MKGIVLAGGSGTRLYPMTKVISKQLQPVYDKPMIYYPISILMLAGIKEICIISTPRDIELFKDLLGPGDEYGVRFEYLSQPEPKGLAQAFIIADEFVGDEDVCMILGDNLFHGDIEFLRTTVQKQSHKSDSFAARVFAYQVEDPARYGVVEFEPQSGRVLSIEEKPEKPKSNYAIPGLYIFDKTASQRARSLTPSDRGELEIVDLIKSYLKEDSLGVEHLGRGMHWLDTGTPESLLEAGQLIHSIEKRQGVKVACLHEVVLRAGTVSTSYIRDQIESMPSSPYKEYVYKVIEDIEGKEQN